MFKRLLATAAALTASQIALAQGGAVVDLLIPPKEGIFPPPSRRPCRCWHSAALSRSVAARRHVAIQGDQ